MDEYSIPASSPEHVQMLQQVQQFWNMSDQQAALSLLRPVAEMDTPWAMTLMAWLTMQQGAVLESIDWAIRAARVGASGQAIHTFNNAMAYLPGDPSIAARLPELMLWAGSSNSGIDVVNTAWNMVAQGQAGLALQLLSLPAPLPLTDEQWRSYVAVARGRTDEIGEHLRNVQSSRSEFDARSGEVRDAIDGILSDLDTKAKQANLHIGSVSASGTAALFKESATRNTNEGKKVWSGGLVVLGLAAASAVLPVVLHYVGAGPDYSPFELLGVHLASTVALGTFAGVLLARARARDNAAQRAHDLSTAMGTMLNYSNQISDPDQKQIFMTSMGQAILQAHLATGSSGGSTDDSVTSLVALTNALRAAPAAPSN